MKSSSETIQMKPTEQDFYSVLFSMLYKVVIHVTFESVFLQSGHSNLKLLGITSFYTKQTFSEFLPGNNDCFGRQVSLQIFVQNRTQTFPHPSKLSLEDRVLHF